MLGALAGDIIGSVHEFLQEKSMDFPLFVEHSRFTDDSVLTIAVADCLLTGSSYIDKFHDYTRAYPDRCYGAGFRHWVESGSREPYNSWGNGAAMRVSPVGFALHTLDDIRPTYSFNESCQGTVPEAIIAFLDSSDYEETVRLAISLGGDADTLACIAGGIAEAFYGGVPEKIAELAMARLDDRLRKTVLRFSEVHGTMA